MELANYQLKRSGSVMTHVENESNGGAPGYTREAASALKGCSVLVVEPAVDELLIVIPRFIKHGFKVTVAETFAQAKTMLLSHPPSILMTALRLGAYIGLHLVLKAKDMLPNIAALVTSPVNDVVLRADAESWGATFIVTPIEEKDFIAAVLQTFFRRNAAGEPIRPPFERRLAERRAAAGSFSDERRSADRRQLLPWTSETIASTV
jgi:response regulator RpfG family c-di-GMP phosphodiesterase